METGTPIGFIQGAGGISSEIMDIMHAAGRKADDDVVFGDTADEVLEGLIKLLNKRNKKYSHLYK